MQPASMVAMVAVLLLIAALCVMASVLWRRCSVSRRRAGRGWPPCGRVMIPIGDMPLHGLSGACCAAVTL